MTYDRATFFAHARHAPFASRLTQQQVDGMDAILDYYEDRHSDLSFEALAYVMATVFHETGGTMAPVRETFADSDKKARAKVKRLGYRYATPDPKTGQVYYGRGLVQLTWAENYQRMGEKLSLDLYRNPDLALDLDISVMILFTGMVDGLFTGRRLRDFFNKKGNDALGARRIINSTDKAHLISTYHKAFLDALNAAGMAYAENKALDKNDNEATPDGADLSKDKTILGGIITTVGGSVGTLFAAVNNPWALGAFIVLGIGLFLIVTGRVEIKYKGGV